jgi:hypothetical protein
LSPVALNVANPGATIKAKKKIAIKTSFTHHLFNDSSRPASTANCNSGTRTIFVIAYDGSARVLFLSDAEEGPTNPLSPESNKAGLS